ncbi:hypothetical protein HN011_011766 [Eciton burchellii]|nr:hypothetical protein HN011_011766 [Eciton burchellii]
MQVEGRRQRVRARRRSAAIAPEARPSLRVSWQSMRALHAVRTYANAAPPTFHAPLRRRHVRRLTEGNCCFRWWVSLLVARSSRVIDLAARLSSTFLASVVRTTDCIAGCETPSRRLLVLPVDRKRISISGVATSKNRSKNCKGNWANETTRQLLPPDLTIFLILISKQQQQQQQQTVLSITEISGDKRCSEQC